MSYFCHSCRAHHNGEPAGYNHGKKPAPVCPSCHRKIEKLKIKSSKKRPPKARPIEEYLSALTALGKL